MANWMLRDIFGNMNMFTIWTTLSILIISVVKLSDNVAVMSVDLGSEWMKVAIVSPGIPMEIALNKESKRKTPVAISFRGEERLFGEDALGTGVRFPANNYFYLIDLIGKKVDNPVVKLFQKRFPFYNIVPDPVRGTVLFKHSEDTYFSPEELLGMMLHKAKEFAQVSSQQQPVNDAVLTVPGYFNQIERKSMLKVAELAGVKVLQLMNDYTAVALNYGIFKSKEFNETAQYIMFYDMGAYSTTASVVSYQTIKQKERGIVETHPQLVVLGVGYDRTLGGLEMQLRLRDYLAKKFNDLKKTSNDVSKNDRAMAKLFKEAGRLKNVLSANNEHYAQVEGLIDEIDFKTLVTRQEFENLCADLFDRVKNPVELALKNSGLTMDLISQVILVGAGTRVPAVQEKLIQVVKMDLSKNINTDEACALGAAYKAADLSAGFKVKKFFTKDAVLFPIHVSYEREVEDSSGNKIAKRTLFGMMSHYPQRKILTFNKHQKDFSFSVHHHDLDVWPQIEVETLGEKELFNMTLTGVDEAINKFKDARGEPKGIKVHYAMDENGILSHLHCEYVMEKVVSPEERDANAEESTFSKISSTLSKMFTATPQLDDEVSNPKSEENTADDNNSTSAQNETQVPPLNEDPPKNILEPLEQEQSQPAEKEKPVLVTVKESVECTAEYKHSQLELTEELFKKAKERIDMLNERDFNRTRREGALNALESAVIDTRIKLSEGDWSAIASGDEAAAAVAKCGEISEWLEDDGFSADVETLEGKFDDLQKLIQPLANRHKELQLQPEAIAAFQKALNQSETFLKSIIQLSNVTIPVKPLEKNETQEEDAQSSPPPPPVQLHPFTQVEIDSLGAMINDTRKWFKNTKKQQSKLKLHDDPVLTVRSIMEKITLLEREVRYLMNKGKSWTPPPPPAFKKPVVKDKDPKPTAEDDKKESGKEESVPGADEEKKLDDTKVPDSEPGKKPVESTDPGSHSEL